ncbi:putative dTDP-4-dehydrorhamnose 3,5-epimerase [Herminiimonas arsenicoxydans]|uniref:dTDP-4-dehydrorhamnose 3,5-epimerase n=1 Tax=Herminiimonas arsenicoxydans TaxID=204773 RepID=A4G477_HERAR|nr:putative dTDP-4-dehydrorhamnose 3,5-epimerase [Herminiimonas arsenicoxydans]
MGAISLDHILVTPLARITVEGGDVLHAIKHSDSGYVDFGEAYFSWVAMGAIKAWKRHTRMTMNIVVPVGQVRFVFHLGGEDSFRIEEIGVEHYARITVPPGIWFGFQGMAEPQSLVLNIADIPHDPSEVERATLSHNNYAWK